jgi:hypothetical protein
MALMVPSSDGDDPRARELDGASRLLWPSKSNFTNLTLFFCVVLRMRHVLAEAFSSRTRLTPAKVEIASPYRTIFSGRLFFFFLTTDCHVLYSIVRLH